MLRFWAWRRPNEWQSPFLKKHTVRQSRRYPRNVTRILEKAKPIADEPGFFPGLCLASLKALPGEDTRPTLWRGRPRPRLPLGTLDIWKTEIVLRRRKIFIAYRRPNRGQLRRSGMLRPTPTHRFTFKTNRRLRRAQSSGFRAKGRLTLCPSRSSNLENTKKPPPFNLQGIRLCRFT